MPIRTVTAPLSVDELRGIAAEQFGDFVKAVVQEGARHADLWGINLYPDRSPEERVEFDAMINVRPSQGNRSRGVEDPAVQERIRVVVARLILS